MPRKGYRSVSISSKVVQEVEKHLREQGIEKSISAFFSEAVTEYRKLYANIDYREAVNLAKYTARAIENTLEEIESNPELTPEQKEIAKEHFTRRVDELLPKYMSLIAQNVIRELTFQR